MKALNQGRALLEQLRREYMTPENKERNVIITESYLFLMANLNGGAKNQLQFFALTNQSQTAPVTSVEKRLDITDRFAVRDMSMVLMKTKDTTAAEVAKGRLHTFPNPNVFTAANEADNLESIYNGWANIQIKSVVYYQNYDVRRFYRVDNAVEGQAVSTVAVTGVNPRDTWNMLNYSFSPVETAFELNGSGSNILSVTLPASIDNSGTNTVNWLCWYFRGYLIQNINDPNRKG